MAEQNNNDLADALSALSAGHHHEPDGHGHDEHVAAPPAAPAGAATPRSAAPKQPAAARPAAPPLARPAAPVARSPVAARPATPVPQGRPVVPARPASPAPPVARRPAASAQPPRTERPSTPTTPVAPAPEPVFTTPEEIAAPPTQEPTSGEEWAGTQPQDDDMMLAPAPDASAFMHHPVRRGPAGRPKSKSETKRTLIPILLTTGIMLCVMGSLKFILGNESTFSNLEPWIIGMIYAFGGVLLALAGFTMMQVHEELKRDAAKRS